MTSWTTPDIENIKKDVQNRLDSRRASSGYQLKTDGHRVDDNWLYLVIQPTRSGIRAYDYTEALHDVEKELHDANIKNVTLVPAMG